MDYVHSPFIIYAPHIIQTPQIFTQIASQMDVFPSIMHLLRIPYSNNTMGINLFENQRPYTIFNAHENYGVIDNEWLFLMSSNGESKLHRYRMNDLSNYAQQHTGRTEQMKTYLTSHLQTYQYLLKN